MLRRLLPILLLMLSPVINIDALDEIPEPMPLADEQGRDIVSFLLLGSDTTNPVNAGRTDVILVLLVDRSTSTISFLSIPRDFYAYIPEHGLNRINTAYGLGEHENGEGGGAKLLEETILYNLGIEIDYYARVDFNGFKTIIDAVGGVDMAVDCAIQDWRLREPDLDVNVEDNWELFTLPMGYHHMDGDLALWYVRSRRTSSDFDRGRRQQDMMRALWRRVNQLGLIQQLPDIWQQVTEMTQTDVTLPDLLGLVPVAANLDVSRMASFT
ncbi:MAG: LCP family protein, partial [Anaerolineae bacterium]|nr:LCP family protein [Anaerolineae bacterium]